MKILFNIVGALAVVLAVLGLFLPLLPATPFLLLASACFMRGSQRMHRWLLHNRLFGPTLRSYEAGYGIPRRAKAIAIAMLWASLSFSIWHTQPTPVRLMLVTIGVAVTVYLLRMKTAPATDQGKTR